jgi:hypothetical protein
VDDAVVWAALRSRCASIRERAVERVRHEMSEMLCGKLVTRTHVHTIKPRVTRSGEDASVSGELRGGSMGGAWGKPAKMELGLDPEGGWPTVATDPGVPCCKQTGVDGGMFPEGCEGHVRRGG